MFYIKQVYKIVILSLVIHLVLFVHNVPKYSTICQYRRTQLTKSIHVVAKTVIEKEQKVIS